MSKNAVFLLKCIFRFSTNPGSKDAARKILERQSLRDLTDEEIGALGRYHGNFIKTCLTGDVIQSWWAGGETEKLAIQLGMKDLFESRATIWNEALDPVEFKETK